MNAASIPFPVAMPSMADLLLDLSVLYKVQPATALWRAVEIAAVLQEGLPDGTGLDLGCGDGALTGLILRHLPNTPRMIGLDNDPREIAVARRRGVYVDTVLSGGESIPLTGASVDFVFSNSVLQHLAKLDQTIGECARVLRPGGTFIATVPAPDFRTLLSARKTTGDARKRYLATMDTRLAHRNYLGPAEWSAMLRRHGLRLVHTRGYLDVRQVRRWERFSNLTAGTLQALGFSNALLYRLQRLTRSDDARAGGLLEQRDMHPARWSQTWARLVAGSVLGPAPEGQDLRRGCLLVRAEKPAADA